MRKIGAFEAKNGLSELLEAAEIGEEVVVTKHGRPIAELTPVDEVDQGRRCAKQSMVKGLALGNIPCAA